MPLKFGARTLTLSSELIMSVEITIPSVGESVSEVEMGEWLKGEGDSVSTDEIVVMLESDKATVELPAPVSGVIGKILKKQGEVAAIGEVVAILEEGSGTSGASNGAAKTAAQTESKPASNDTPAPGANGLATGTTPPQASDENARVMPAAARELAQNDMKAGEVSASGPGGRVLKSDVQSAVEAKKLAPIVTPPPAATPKASAAPVEAGEDEEVVRMTPLRRKIAQRLVEAQQTAALLTTFNEADMSAVMELRREHQDAFTKKNGIKLGFMSFFVKAAIDALKAYPAINAEIRGDSIVYRNHYDIGVAIGGGKALVVPVLKHAERMSFAEIELAISDFAGKVKSGKISPDELSGGTFTITNGGIYGSLLSTPIVNAPQSGILGMHSIQERPVARNGEVVIRPMMYLALTYDHRIVDGREAVSFLKRLADCIENPSRMLLEV